MLTRLNKYLADSGICSRRKADEQILKGSVKVNEKTAELGDKIDPENDTVYFLGNPVVASRNQYIYYALNKPRGVISTSSDEKGRQSIVDFVPKNPRVYPVGRLDRFSEGLILLTNDGEFAQKMTHPKFEHEKEYQVKIRSSKSEILNKSEIQNVQNRFLNGLQIDGKLMKAIRAHIEPLSANSYILNVVLVTGHNRQIRKMCAKMNLDIFSLKRIRIGKLTLDELKLSPGEYKIVSKSRII